MNYDGLAGGRARQARPSGGVLRAGLDREPAGKAAVWHLHGRLIRAASGKRWQREGGLVLSGGELRLRRPRGGYLRNSWWRSVCAARSACSSALSMTDPNFIRWLKQLRGGGWWSAFRDLRSPGLPDCRSAPFGEILETSAAARWALRQGNAAVWANYYGEVAQIVHEIGGCAVAGATRWTSRCARGRVWHAVPLAWCPERARSAKRSAKPRSGCGGGWMTVRRDLRGRSSAGGPLGSHLGSRTVGSGPRAG